jgi:hypothetical protein
MPETQQADEEEWVDVARFPNLDEAHENALVALAMGEAIRVDHGDVPGEFELRVEPAAAPRVTEELREYAAESEVKPPRPPLVSQSWSHHPAGAVHYLVWATILLLVFRQQSQDPTLADRYASSSIGLDRLPKIVAVTGYESGRPTGWFPDGRATLARIRRACR